jgi:hypothetical protein
MVRQYITTFRGYENALWVGAPARTRLDFVRTCVLSTVGAVRQRRAASVCATAREVRDVSCRKAGHRRTTGPARSRRASRQAPPM